MNITKSVSRFARNLLDCIGWVRELKDKRDPPIAVFFEQEHLNTLDTTSNIILFVLAMVAEEESHMKSEAMLLSLEWRFSRGRFMTPALLGYDKVEVPDGQGGHKKVLAVNEEEALTVRLIYYMILNGSSLQEIAGTLTDLGRETGLRKRNGRPNAKWTVGSVVNVIRNERYCGDVLARKTWTPDFHDHKSKKNNGKKNKYYQPGHHEAIVTRAQWNAAQRILTSHRFGHEGSYLPMMVIDHGALTGYISVNRFWAGYEGEEFYRVCSIAMGLTEGSLETDLENEHLPDGGHRISGMTGDNGVQRIARVLSQNEIALKAQLEGKAPEEGIRQDMPRSRSGFQVVSGSMFSHEMLEQTCERRVSIYKDVYDQAIKDKQEVEKKVAALEDQLVRSLMGESGSLDSELVNTLIAKYREKLASAEAVAREAQERMEEEKANSSEVLYQYEEFVSWAESFTTATIPVKRMILSKLIDRIDIGAGYDIHITYKLTAQEYTNPAA